MKIQKIMTRAVLALFPLLAAQQASASADYPNKPIRIVVAYAPGGSTDIVARLFAQELGTKLGQPILVENRAGAGTLIGTESVIKAPPDGYTLFWGTPATVITPLLHKKPTYDVLKDLQPVTLATTQSMGVLVSDKIGINNVSELVKYAKANPGKVNFASSGNGSAQHLAAEALNNAANINMLHIPYKGAGVALNDLVAGRVDVMITSLVGNMMEQVKEGRIKLIATTGPERSSTMANIPTVAEGGVPNFGIRTWTALFAPTNTPPEVIDKLNRAMVDIQKDGSIQKKIENQAMDVTVVSPKELSAMLSAESDFYSAILKQTSTKLD
ncbi:tripartite tricarboxylate transporter substrate binding protein [Zwartia sp.]|uniref:Bug family tripartite tricarboxylate transporter substrate binding protein n=1 Tax=Zwartia sp. TaxID=2978004 RepID=UPI0027194B96|nr:tripartite tricarboxylate transporter substrate binding protein [Zwartia sp.]MDO9023069.1 tripartite tricarboxylate transporter substrate binding protein [Zwartia sp.]